MPDKPDILLVVLDSARKDRMSVYGHNRETAPVLEKLSDTATTFENAYTPAPWTLPSHTSLFTGLFPTEHGVTNGFTDGNLRLSSEISTLAEQLSAEGYRTAGFSNNPWVGKLSGLNRGFDEFVEWDLEVSNADPQGKYPLRKRLYSEGHSLLGHASRQPLVLLKRRFFTSELVDSAKRWLDRTETSDAPTFTFLNLMEAHSPYYPPASAFERLGLEPPSSIEARVQNTNLLAYVMGKKDLSQRQRERVLEHYDASLRYQDVKLTEILNLLGRRDTFDETAIVVCADHGKTLGEFDRQGTPPHYVRDININVPLFLKRPHQRSGDRIESPFELTDLHCYLVGEQSRLNSAEREYTLTEDFVPHTGREVADVTRWRVLSDGERKYVRSDDGDEYVLAGDSVDESVVPASGTDIERLREAFEERTERLSRKAESVGESGAGMDGSVEAQLQDLGYLS